MATSTGASLPAPIWQRPWPLALAGLGTAFASVLVAVLAVPALDPLRLALVALALLLAGVAVLYRLRGGVKDSEDRTEPACLLAFAALVAFVTYLALLGDWQVVALQSKGQEVPEDVAKAFNAEWDSGRMLAGVLGVVALVGSALVFMPSLPRKILVSLIILFHFGGILTAVTAQPAGNGAPPWIPVQAWAHVYHPYLQFIYMTNAYHFYSPEPGPATLLWFRVQYQSGESRWIKIPSRAVSPMPIHYIRNLAMAETVNNFQPVDEMTRRQVYKKREEANMIYNIPLHPGIAENEQYRKPGDYAILLGAAYARHIARTSPNPNNPDDPVVSVKLYRVTHRLLEASEIARGMSPIDKTTYLPFYCGDFDTEGKLTDPNDGLLYWLIPILYRNGPDHPDDVIDYVEFQSGYRTPAKTNFK
jgi:hypothetical protein